jgi:hypothetical protein
LNARRLSGGCVAFVISPNGLEKNSTIAGGALSSIYGKLEVAERVSETLPH